MGFEPQVARWREHVSRELQELGVPLPPSHVLAIIDRESNGRSGAVNPKSGASGLMQVMPIALRDYNNNHTEKYSMSQLRGQDDSSAAIQIRVGTWILKQFIKSAYHYLKKRLGTVSLDDLVRVGDTFYAAGPARAKSYINRVAKPTWESIRAQFPTWDRVKPAERVWDKANDDGAVWNLQAIDHWLESQIQEDKTQTAGGAILGLLLMVAAWFLFKKGTH